MGTYPNICDHRYRTELDIGTSDIGLKRAESDIISNIRINFYPISDIQTFINQHSGWEIRCSPLKTSVLGSNPADVLNIFWIADVGMDSDVNIGTLPISEWQFSVLHIFVRYWKNRCRCQMSDIANIKVNVDAHLCPNVNVQNCKYRYRYWYI